MELPEGSTGYRALFKGTVESRTGRNHFRMAAALLAPDRFRLEFLGPVGGPRLVVAVDGVRALALLPADRAYDSDQAQPEAMDRLLGLPLTPSQVIALLTGRPMCDPDVSEQQVHTRTAAAFARTLAWFAVTCPPDEIRYEARSRERGGTLRDATVREGVSGARLLDVDYDDYQEGLGPRWPRRIRLRLVRRDATVELIAIEGPAPGEVPPSMFAPSIPDGFEKRALLSTLGAPGFMGVPPAPER